MALRSSTMFRLLCAAIGVLSLGLLGMVGVMVYPSLASGEAAQGSKPTAVKPRVRQLIKPKEVAIDQNLAQLSDFLYPPPKTSEQTDIWSRATDEFHGWTMVGLASEGDDKGFVFLQHKGDNRTLVMTVQQFRKLDELAVEQIHNGMVKITVNGETGALRRSVALAGPAGQPGTPGGPGPMAGTVGAATWNGAGLPPPAIAMPTVSTPPPVSRVTFSGRMIGGPPSGPPTVSSSATPTAGPDNRARLRQMRGQRGGGGPNGPGQ